MFRARYRMFELLWKRLSRYSPRGLDRDVEHVISAEELTLVREMDEGF